MREIKFRGWFQCITGIEYWVYGYPSKQENGNWEITNDAGISFTVDEPEQYTGLNDNVTGKEIYEGDILEVVYYNHTGKNTKLIQEVYYLDESGCFCVKTVGKELAPIENDRNNVPISWTSPPNTIMLLGNIHENPELLNTN